MSLTLDQRTNINGVPKAAELIEISGGHALEASDRAIMNMGSLHDLYKIVRYADFRASKGLSQTNVCVTRQTERQILGFPLSKTSFRIAFKGKRHLKPRLVDQYGLVK
jgi:hypothetical protein